jgi:hypothetical protein
MKEISKSCSTYCHSQLQKWAELILHIEFLLNTIPVELLFGAERNNLFQKRLPKLPKREMKHEDVQEKTAKAY